MLVLQRIYIDKNYRVADWWKFRLCLQNDAHTLAPASLQLLQQLQATTSAATPVAANAGAANALSNVQHQLLLQQHLGLGAATPAHAAPPAVPSPAEINPANLQSLATLASLSNTAGEYGQCRLVIIHFIFAYFAFIVLPLFDYELNTINRDSNEIFFQDNRIWLLLIKKEIINILALIVSTLF